MTALWSAPERRSEHCATCAGGRLFEQPPCLDGHQVCPEWACLECGHALVAGLTEVREPARHTEVRELARHMVTAAA